MGADGVELCVGFLNRGSFDKPAAAGKLRTD
jgi:hypothetical protein